MNPIHIDGRSKWSLAAMVVVAFVLLGVLGCQSIPSGNPVPTYSDSLPDTSVAVVRLVSAESAFWRLGQNAYIENIDGQINGDWTRAKLLKFKPGAHRIKLIYCANAGGAVHTSGGILHQPSWQNVYDRQELAFEVLSEKTYDLVYAVKQWPTPHELRLRLIDCTTQQTIADSGASTKQGIMPLGTIP